MGFHLTKMMIIIIIIIIIIINDSLMNSSCTSFSTSFLPITFY